jgi:glycosyltransferase involved in cell wall biosynthesis
MGGGGAERQLTYLCAELVRAHVEVHVACKVDGPNAERLRSSGAVLHDLPPCNNHSPQLWRIVARQVAKTRPHILQTWLTQMDILGGLVAWRSGVPWILSERNSARAYPPHWKHSFRRWLARRAEAVVSNSTSGDTYWQAASAVRRRKVIPNGIPLDELDTIAPANPSEIGVVSGEKLILFAGRLEAQKNLDNLLLALERVFKSTPARVVLCGNGPDRQRLEDEVRSRPWASHIVFQGYVTNLAAWMKRADVFVSVSWNEGRPNAVIEAMACGCPIVASSIPEHCEFLDDGCARLVDPADVASIATAIEGALADGAGSAGRSRAARTRAAQWSVQSMAGEYLRLYQEILTQPIRRRSPPVGAAAVSLDLSKGSTP